VSLKKVVSWLKGGQKGPFLREICPLEKMTPKYDAASGIIAGELLKVQNEWLREVHFSHFFIQKLSKNTHEWLGDDQLARHI
jgi:hypothetical protein